MGTRVPFIFQIVLLLGLPLAFAYLIAVAGLVFITLRAALKSRRLRRRSYSDPASASR